MVANFPILNSQNVDFPNKHFSNSPEQTVGCFIDILCHPQNHSLNLNFLIALMTEPIWSCWSCSVTFLLWCRSLMQHWRGTVDGIFMWRTLYWTACLLGCLRGTNLQHINHYSFKSESGGIHARNEYCTPCTWCFSILKAHNQAWIFSVPEKSPCALVFTCS